MLCEKWKLRQRMVLFCHIFMLVPARCVFSIILIYFLIYGQVTRWIILAYLAYMMYDYNSPTRGGRRCNRFRTSSYFSSIADYFPIELVQTEELDRNKNYLGIFHPHAVLFFANTVTLTADAFELEKRSGIQSYTATLNFNFIWPLVRDYYLATGYISADEASIKYVLNQTDKGRMVTLVPGGAAEAGLAEPEKYEIILHRRKGFCRIAIQTGACLVPMFIFGEVNCFDVNNQAKDGFFKNIQGKFQEWTGVNPIVFRNKDSWIPFFSMPRQTPITLVMGKVIPVEKNENPSAEDILSLHQHYMNCLKELFDEHKHKYLKNPSSELIMS